MVVGQTADPTRDQTSDQTGDRLARRRADRVFHALADATRRDILVRTLRAEYSVSGLARLYPMSFAAIQKHVVVLETAGLVTKQRRGREQLVSGQVDAIRDANLLLAHFESVWLDRLDRFGEVLADTSTEEGATP